MEEIRERLEDAVREVFGVEVLKQIEVEVMEAPEGTGADYASNVAMRLAGVLKIAPREIAERIREKYGEGAGDDAAREDVKIEIAGAGFLNFTLRDEYFLRKIQEMQGEFEKNISCDEYLGEKVICEFSDPNPFKVLHVGHLFTTVIGEAIAKLYEFAGAKVARVNFGGDVGMHVAKTMYALLGHEVDTRMSATETVELIAKCYVEGARAYEDDSEAKKEIVKINKEIYRIAEEEILRTGDSSESDVFGADSGGGLGEALDSENGSGEVSEWTRAIAERYWWGREASYKYFDEFYEKVGVKFDRYYPESTVAGRGIEEVEKGLAKGVFEKSDGATVFKGEKYGLHTRVFINREGLPTYEAKDLGLGFTKWDDYRFNRNVIITGNDIIDYMKVVLKAAEMIEEEPARRTRHITHGNLRLEGGVKMSSRKGNFLKAQEVIEEVLRVLKEENGSEDMRVALGAIKYAFLKGKIQGNTNFSIRESVKMAGNSGPYLQYATVRAKRILGAVASGGSGGSAAFEASGISGGAADFGDYEMNEFEKKLVKKLCSYRGVLGEAALELAPHKIATYLYELAQEFSRFYENCKVVGAKEEAVRIVAVAVYAKVMEHGLGMLGIEVPEEM